MKTQSGPRMEFHIARTARVRYRFDESLFALTGNYILVDAYAARVMAQKMNAERDLARFPERTVRAGELNAMGLLDEISHYIVAQYREQINSQAMAEALDWIVERLGEEVVDAALLCFAEDFPPLAVHRGDLSATEYLEGETSGTPNRQVLLEEMLMLWLENLNPAFAPFQELFDDDALEAATGYRRLIDAADDFFETQPPFGPDRQPLVAMLRAPALASPDSLSGQLAFVRDRWGMLLGRAFHRLLGGLDLISEEQKAVFAGPGPARVYDYRGLSAEEERFSPDLDWMPQTVLIAKHTYVWLDQLSRKYGRAISRLDQVPDEELDALARQGFTGLWLIGLWERSPASQRIKQRMGNPEAVASAYSVYDYAVAVDLGGDAACLNLRERAWQRGIRLASDMVPNHMGIDSRWIIEHPDWFIGLDHSPFPGYSFSGPDLCDDERVAVLLEDHYYDRTDAAVVFKRVDRWTGSERYIYHGNDGTTMPWNDTAQLDFLQAEVREAVTQLILHVARMFPIIRFDAAMTLAKKHFQRLWYPEPGTGGAIPSRGEHGLTREQFDALVPQEFWREVVDRAAQEAPNTLFLAEAFWLMEGYFVRTLGMHRVYNSAFMNMLRDEKNAEYRLAIKNTLEFDPRILRRYVNFMNNPDERTAVDQFGKDDKYFGVCIMMATMPGLPMFGHGQIEGYAEKYGMEYRRAYWDERPDPALGERHEREVFPLLQRRRLFAEVDDFLLYDLFTLDGHVDENVFAYSNRAGDERALVLCHNRYAEARGWVRMSVAYADPSAPGDGARRQRSLGEGLGLHPEGQAYTIFRDHITGLEYIRSSQELCERGLYVELGAYKYQVFLDFREVWDDESHHYGNVAAHLNGRGVPSVEETARELVLWPVLEPFRRLVQADTFRRLMPPGEPDASLLRRVRGDVLHLLRAVRQRIGGSGDVDAVADGVMARLRAVLRLPDALDALPADLSPANAWAAQEVQAALAGDAATWGTLLGWVFVQDLGRVADGPEGAMRSRDWLDEWLLGKALAGALRDLGVDEQDARRAMERIRVLMTHRAWLEGRGTAEEEEGPLAAELLTAWLQDEATQRFIGLHRYDEVLWFHQESYEEFLRWMLLAAAAEALGRADRAEADVTQWMADRAALLYALHRAEEGSGYRLDRLLDAVQ